MTANDQIPWFSQCGSKVLHDVSSILLHIQCLHFYSRLTFFKFCAKSWMKEWRMRYIWILIIQRGHNPLALCVCDENYSLIYIITYKLCILKKHPLWHSQCNLCNARIHGKHEIYGKNVNPPLIFWQFKHCMQLHHLQIQVYPVQPGTHNDKAPFIKAHRLASAWALKFW